MPSSDQNGNQMKRGFCRLKFLLLESRDLVHWRTMDYHLPSLTYLVPKFCYQLKEIPCDIGDIPTLQIIELHSGGPLLRSLPEEFVDSNKAWETIAGSLH
ncbi:hypothetical protein RND71_010735 [Anisodus tanguticus]|uniref:Uncharacterized protein n=1 Tax=Anisodus tanguticus TaxID=243964 RepID=A0AAE1VSX9_9SOLA|nr:hypothetical protein RND71_010735 [Anisodus tanguticus]